MEWKTVNICDMCDSISATYSRGADMVVLINTSDVLDGKFLNRERVPNKDLKGQFKKTFKRDDILYSEIRPANKRFAYVDFDAIDYIASTKLMVLRAKPNVNPLFLYHILKSEDTLEKLQMLAESRSGTFPQITYSEMANVSVLLPDRATQDKVVAILSSLDDKIENNNRINRNLEEQAQALFKSWFVDFEPFGGTMPEDWRETTIGEMCTCYLGGTPSRAKSEYWNGDIPWINSGEVNKYRIIEGSEYITELGLKKSATKLLPKKTTVLAITGATLGQVSLLEIEACANQSVIGILENEKMPYEFIYPLIVNDIDKIILNQTGGAQQHINKDNVASHNIIIPTDEIMAIYKAIQAPLFESIANNCLESARLAAMRDTLLPKLMKGEIEV